MLYLIIFSNLNNKQVKCHVTFQREDKMQFVVCFILGLGLLCVSTMTLLSCLPIFSTTALLDDYAFALYFVISCFGFCVGGYFMAIARV